MYFRQPKDQEVHAQEQGLRRVGRPEGQRQRHAARGQEGRLRAGQDTLQVRSSEYIVASGKDVGQWILIEFFRSEELQYFMQGKAKASLYVGKQFFTLAAEAKYLKCKSVLCG